MIFSVIIPTCNRNDLLRKCLEALSPSVQTIGAANYEVIVTDDSKDNLADKMIKTEFSWAKWVSGPKKGPASNRNHGAKQASAEWLVFIDDDVVPNADVLNIYKTSIQNNPGKLAFEGSIIPDNWGLMKKEMAECPINTEGNCFWSANICVQKKLFYSLSGFDELFLIPAQEDQDMFERLKQHTDIPFLKNCVVVHPVRFGSLKKKITGMNIQFRNWIYYIKKHSKISVKIHLWNCVGGYIKMSLKDILKMRYRLFTLHMLNSFYCFYLFIKYRNE